MNPLLYLLIIPTLTMVGIVLTKDLKNVRVVAAIGMTGQLVFSFVLLFWFYKLRNEGNTDAFLFVSSTMWYDAFNIQLKFGIDGVALGKVEEVYQYLF